jgi:EAL domain-containing protein (putative c-di-GMP-specific phosphodiesterase class I)
MVFDGGMRTDVVSRLTLETELRDAARQRQMRLFYQPIVELESRRIVGFEALLRWRHPEKGWLSPGSFFHVAEETGYFVEQLPWLLEQACAALVQWNEGREGEGIYVSFNLSRRQLHHPHLVRDIERALKHSGVAPSLLRLELTEMAIAEYRTATRSLLTTLREMGLLLYIDDFGTGYSSLGHIQELPIHALKIDRGFISSWEPGNDRPGIVRAVLSLAEHLEIDVVAEGIETEHQRGRLLELGCPHGQGFLFAEALPVDVCHRLLP